MGIIYFAYGSNMSLRRLKSRVSSAVFLEVGILAGYRLAFHKVSKKDGSAKCDVVKSEPDVVYGALFNISDAELPALDAHEGNNQGYKRRLVSVQRNAGGCIDAQTYMATNIDSSLRPYSWYVRHVLEGAHEAKLPTDYLAFIEAVGAIADPDPQREARELAIYG